MSGVQICQIRSIGLWNHGIFYVKSYINIHHTSRDEQWLQQCHKLITDDKILTKYRHFQYIEYKITGKPGANVAKCITTTFG